jgi:hypothetical protein
MDGISRRIATATFTWQSVLLQALLHNGVPTGAEVPQVADKAIAVASGPGDDEGEVAEIAIGCPEQVPEGLAMRAAL